MLNHYAAFGCKHLGTLLLGLHQSIAVAIRRFPALATAGKHEGPFPVLVSGLVSANIRHFSQNSKGLSKRF